MKNKKLSKVFGFADFASALKFVNQVASLAENEGHHPDISISYNKVHLTLSTHDIGDVSSKDYFLAEKIDDLVL